MDEILEQARKKVNSLKFRREAIDEIPNDLLSLQKSEVETEDFFIDDSLREMFYPKAPMFFPQPSSDDREEFGDDLIVFKSPALATVNIAKKDFKKSLENIIDDLNLNIAQLETVNEDLSRQTPKKDNKNHDVIIKKLVY